MSVAVCRYCDHDYWRYARAFPPPGFCSLPCSQASRAARDHRTGADAPGIPSAIIEIMYSHRRIIHKTISIAEWIDCAECERLEEMLRQSREWHVDLTASSDISTPYIQSATLPPRI